MYALLALLNIGLVLMASGIPNPNAILSMAILLACDIGMLWGARLTVRRAEQRRVDLKAVLADFREDDSVDV